MALPSSRNRTYSATDPVISADLNDLQDQIIAHETDILSLQAANPASRVVTVSPSAMSVYEGTPSTSNKVAVDGSSIAVPGGGTGGYVLVPLQLDVGETITAFSVGADQTSAGTITAKLMKIGVNPRTSSDIDSATSTSTAEVTLTKSGISEVVASGYAYCLRVTTTNNDQLLVLAANVTVSRAT